MGMSWGLQPAWQAAGQGDAGEQGRVLSCTGGWAEMGEKPHWPEQSGMVQGQEGALLPEGQS